MISRRLLLTGSAASALAVLPSAARAEAVLTEDGIYRQP